MKRFTTLFLLTILVATTGLAKPKYKDLSGEIAVKGALTKEYQQSPAGTPAIIRRVVKMKNLSENSNRIHYAIEINGIQYTVPSDEIGIIAISTPETDRDFWQQLYLKNHLYEYFDNHGYREDLRYEVNEECIDYLTKLHDIAYEDDYITSYVQGVFAKLNATGIDAKRSENLNVRVIQSPDPEAFMLPNGSMIISTGLLANIDTEDELAAIMANEIFHFVLDHQIYNIHRAEQRAKRAVFWADVFATVSDVAYDIAWWDYNEKAYNVSLVADIGTITSLLCIPVIDRLGMKYKNRQEDDADRLACKLLAFKGYNPDALSSALGKISNCYELQNRRGNLLRYGSVDDLHRRIEKAGNVPETQNQRLYLKAMSDVVTFNAALNLANKRYKEAARLTLKNIDNGLATDNDYVNLVKAEMALYNSEESNNRCLSMLDRAQVMAGDNFNLDIYKQQFLLLMRMNEQTKAIGILKKYLNLLNRYQSQDIEGEEKEWSDKEITWANQMLDKMNRI